ncbi:MAG: hypothetical protein OXE95_02755 [Chloroflexi bacterium]|nr:hypothetical protein [Chloroflexota bacterium]MCY4246482.1 hypothetical protein [Chloroflexota bacterium]
MKRIAIAALLASLFLGTALAGAEEACDTAEIQADIQAQLDLLDENPVSALINVIDLALAGFHDCSGEVYEFSDREGAQPVLGPLALSEGLHIVTMTTAGSARIDGVAIKGCGKELDGVIHNFSSGQAIRGAASLVEVLDDCIVYLELSKLTNPWILTIDKLN